jgi:hypothetical protein
MQTRTVSPDGYQNFFDSFSRIYAGNSATFEILSKDLGAQHEVDEQPLRGISYDREGLELHLTASDGTHVVHRIPHPIKVQIEENESGLIEAIEIESDDDPTAILHLNPPLASKLLRGQTL